MTLVGHFLSLAVSSSSNCIFKIIKQGFESPIIRKTGLEASQLFTCLNVLQSNQSLSFKFSFSRDVTIS